MRTLVVSTILAVATAFAAHADEKHHQGTAAPALVEGEVRRIDRDAQKITIRHGPLPQLDMPQPMTMVYRVKDPALLDKAKAGDKVKFAAENDKGTFTVTRIEPAK
jgi:Cu/Ag efflux protein CusF